MSIRIQRAESGDERQDASVFPALNDASQTVKPFTRPTASPYTCALTTMSASASSTSQPVQSTSAAVEHTKDDDVPHLGVLEEDDEFEEFAVAGTSS